MASASPSHITRVSRACVRCRKNKSRCDRFRPCSLCIRARAVCEEGDGTETGSKRPADSVEQSLQNTRLSKVGRTEASPNHPDGLALDVARESAELSPHSQQIGGDSTIGIAARLRSLQQQQPAHRNAVSAIPGAKDNAANDETESLRSCGAQLMHALPDDHDIDILLHDYFDSIHWFSLVVVEQKLRAALHIKVQHRDVSSSLLLSTMLGLAAWYSAHAAEKDEDRRQRLHFSRQMITNAESQILSLMDRYSVTNIQTLVLLGSYYVYHGRPNLSFSLLGATIKAAQSMGLHQSPSASLPPLDRQERIRLWWTIYTWDRFASINYGRPLTISDHVCDVEQPDDFEENHIFVFPETSYSQSNILYSSYQRELNRLYQIASPAIERLHRTYRGQQTRTASEYRTLVEDITIDLVHWRNQLPPHLQMSDSEDCMVELSAGAKAHVLQALSLYLSFNSLILVLYRPFLTQPLQHLFSSDEDDTTSNEPSPTTRMTRTTTSHEQLWNAAVKMTRISELPRLAQHANDGHLINFLTMNMFNAAVIMIVVALVDPLSDRAQEAKRTVSRVYRMQKVLQARSLISNQVASVLKGLLQVLVDKESDAIFGSTTMSYQTDTQSYTVPHDPSTTIGERRPAQSATAAASRDGLEYIQRTFLNPSRRPSLGENTRSAVRGEDPPAESNPLFSDDGGLAAYRGNEEIMDSSMQWLWDSGWDNFFGDQVFP